jgi:hypothetical protein
VNKLIITTGPSFSDPMMNSELVDYHANINIINQFSLYLKETNSISGNSDSDSDKVVGNDDDKVSTIVSFKKDVLNLSQWVRLDDVIMGGKLALTVLYIYDTL